MAVLEEEGLHRAAAHQRRAHPHRQGLPAVRRPARAGQADVAGRAARDPGVPRRRGGPRRRRRPHGPAARAADPPGRRRAVPLADPLHGAPRRAACRSAPARLMLVLIIDTGRVEQRVVDAAVDRVRRGRALGATCAPRLNGAVAGRRLADVAAPLQPCRSSSTPATATAWPAVLATLLETPGRGARGAGRARRHRQPRAVRHGLPAHRRRRCSRRWRSRWCCCGCSARWPRPDAVAVRIGHENPPGACGDLGRQPSATAGGDVVASLGVLGPTRMDYPATMARRPRRRPVSRSSPSIAGAPLDPDGHHEVSDYVERLLRRPRRRAATPTPEEIKRAYRRLARELHPDVNPDPEAQERFKEVTPGLRGALRPGEARDVRPRWRPLRRRRGGGFGQGFALQRHHGRVLRRPAAARAAARAAPAPRPGRPDPPRARPRRGGVRRQREEIQVDTAVVCPTCAGAGRQPGTGTSDLRRSATARRGPAGAALVPRPGHDVARRARSAAASARSSRTPARSAPARAGSAPAAR